MSSRTARLALTKALGDAGYKILFSYSDPRRGGKRKKIEVGMPLETEEEMAREYELGKGAFGRFPWEIWGYMPAHLSEVQDILWEFYPQAEFEGYRGSTAWLAIFTWFEPTNYGALREELDLGEDVLDRELVQLSKVVKVLKRGRV